MTSSCTSSLLPASCTIQLKNGTNYAMRKSFAVENRREEWLLGQSARSDRIRNTCKKESERSSCPRGNYDAEETIPLDWMYEDRAEGEH